MKEKFKEYIGFSKEEKERIWSEGTFVFDTNILLNLYRYTNETRTALLDSLRTLEDNIWSPNQIILEMMKRRCEVIIETEARCFEINTKKSSFISEIQEKLRLKPNGDELSKLEKLMTVWIEERKAIDLLVSSPSNDEILNQLLVLYDGKVGEEFNAERLNKIFSDGKDRYEKKIPPGYKDDKKNLDQKNSGFGDLILWQQIMEYSKESKKNVIFVTDDQKEDWWQIVKGKTIGPRPELLKEFFNTTNQELLMYSMKSFLEYMSANRIQSISQEVLNEVKEVNANIEINVNTGISYEEFLKSEEALARERDLLSEIDKLEKKIKQKTCLQNKNNVPINTLRYSNALFSTNYDSDLNEIKSLRKKLEYLKKLLNYNE